MTTISDGHYCGHNSIIEALGKDLFYALIEGEFQKVSRWALNTVDPGLRNQKMLKEADKQAQFAKTHRGATIKSGEISITPSKDLVKTSKYHRPIIAVRVFHGGAQAVINNVAYYFYYGYVRCNLAQDKHLEEGVYAYVDIDSALSKIDQDSTIDRTKCLGIVEGYLKHKHENKVCLDSRSCRLIAVFSPWCTDIHLPFTLGAEDALAFRLPPLQSGGTIKMVSTAFQHRRQVLHSGRY